MKSTTWIQATIVIVLALVSVLMVVTTGHAIPMPSQPSTARASSLAQGTNIFTGTATVPENVFFAEAGSLNQARIAHTATLLPDGKVLIAGGYDRNDALSTAELYDPTTSTFTATGSLNEARSGHTATLLQNDKVLIAGGGVAMAELYDPSSGTFASAGNIQYARGRHTATLLSNGKVLIAGGYPGWGTAELYDPSTETFTPTGNMQYPHYSHTATLLPDGKVLLTGSGTGSAAAELYDPSSGTFGPTGSMQYGHGDHTATLLSNSKVLIAGGYKAYDLAELYDPSSETFAPTGSMQTRRSGHTATLLPNSKVLIVGGDYDAPAELYDPPAGTFTATGSLEHGRSYRHTATLLANGKVLVVGGAARSDAPISSAELGTLVPSNLFTGTLTLPSGWVTTRTANVSFSGTTSGAALDAGSLSNDASDWGSWIPATNGETITTTWDLGSDGADKPVYLRLRDVNGQVATVVTGTANVDTAVPSSSMTPLPPFSSSAISLSWSGSDNVSGIASYDLQVREGTTGEWTPVLTGTTATSTLYYGTLWQAYYFRVRSTDVAGNVEAWPDTYDTATLVTEAATWNLYFPLILKAAP